jgi:hypothetical protein
VVAEFWSEIAQDRNDQDEEWFYAQERKDGAFLLSEAELMRVGSDVAYLDIS